MPPSKPWIGWLKFPTLPTPLWQAFKQLRDTYQLTNSNVLPFLLLMAREHAEQHPDRALAVVRALDANVNV